MDGELYPYPYEPRSGLWDGYQAPYDATRSVPRSDGSEAEADGHHT